MNNMYNTIVSRICFALDCTLTATHSEGFGVRNCRNPHAMSHLIDATRRILMEDYLPHDEVTITRAIVMYAPSLARSWHQFDMMARRIVTNYVRTTNERALAE